MHLLQLVADRMALVIGHVRLYEAEQRARGEAESLAAERDAILRQIADGVVIADPSGAVVFANDVAKRLLGLTDEPGIPVTLRTGGYQVLTQTLASPGSRMHGAEVRRVAAGAARFAVCNAAFR